MELAAQLAADAAERLFRYVQLDTQSEEDSETYPSTEKQLELLRLLLDELQQIGIADAQMDVHGYVTATIPATVEGDIPTIAFFAHVGGFVFGALVTGLLVSTGQVTARRPQWDET